MGLENESGNAPLPIFTLEAQHSRLRKAVGLPRDFVMHSLRRTMLPRQGVPGVDPFTIMRMAGDSSVIVSGHNVHPTPEALERAFEQLETLNGRTDKGLPEATALQLLPTAVNVVERVAG